MYNVGITLPDEQPLTEQDIIRHFKADVVGAYSCIKAVAVCKMSYWSNVLNKHRKLSRLGMGYSSGGWVAKGVSCN